MSIFPIYAPLNGRIDEKLEEFSISWSNNMAKLMARLEGMLADNPKVKNINCALKV